MAEIKSEKVKVEPDSQPEAPLEAWDEAQNEAALADLERLQTQIDLLRDAIPNLIAPLLDRHATPVQVFTRIKSSALQTTQRIAKLRETFDSDRTKEIFQHGAASLAADGDLTLAENVPRYGWAKD